MRILVTGASGFVGKNLQIRLGRMAGIEILSYDIDNKPSQLYDMLAHADAIIHLAGINRPLDPAEYLAGNLGITSEIASWLETAGRAIPIIFSSSIQAELDNDYGISKRAAEERLESYAKKTGAPVSVFRFANIFGKWCKPNYNSAVATFCYNIAHGLPIVVRDPLAPLHLIYIDDVVESFVSRLHVGKPGFVICSCEPIYKTTVGAVAAAIQTIRDDRESGLLPNLSDNFLKRLYTTYLSYLDLSVLPKIAEIRSDERGWLFELVKSEKMGQIFVSTTKPGKKRGNHYHDTKVEKFCLIKGQARISLRKVTGSEQVDFDVDDKNIRIVDIPPGYTHNIQNTGSEDCIVIFWANEIFDQAYPDTYYLEV